MARKRRNFIPFATYHVMLRGNHGQAVFTSDKERYRFCMLLQHGVERYHHKILAFCFMTNHIHLIIQVQDVPLSKICHNLSFRYTQFINKNYGVKGHLFQGRFKAILIENHRYLKRLIRYIHLNPVEAQLVKDPIDYPWSSHRTYLSKNQITWLSIVEILSLFDDNKLQAQRKFDEFVRDPAQGKKAQGDAEKMFSAVVKQYQIDENEIQNKKRDKKGKRARSMMAYLAKETKGITLEEAAKFCLRHKSSFSKLASEFYTELNDSDELREEYDDLLQEFDQLR